MNLEQLLDQIITLRGIAVDDAACAILEVDEIQRNVYLVDLASWGDDGGKHIEATGTLRYRQLGQDARTIQQGQLAVHGMVGKRFVLEGAQWKLIA